MTAETAAMIMMSGAPDLEELEVTKNGVYESVDHDGFSKVTVDVPPDLEDITVTENGEYQSEDHDGFGVVTVNVPQSGQPDLEDIIITENGEYQSEQHDGYRKVTVEVAQETPEQILSDIPTVAQVQVTDSVRVVLKWATDTHAVKKIIMPEYIDNTGEHRPTFIYNDIFSRTYDNLSSLYTNTQISPAPSQSNPWLEDYQYFVSGTARVRVYCIMVKATINETISDDDLFGERFMFFTWLDNASDTIGAAYGIKTSGTQDNVYAFGLPTYVQRGSAKPTSLTVTKTMTSSLGQVTIKLAGTYDLAQTSYTYSAHPTIPNAEAWESTTNEHWSSRSFSNISLASPWDTQNGRFYPDNADRVFASASIKHQIQQGWCPDLADGIWIYV